MRMMQVLLHHSNSQFTVIPIIRSLLTQDLLHYSPHGDLNSETLCFEALIQARPENFWEYIEISFCSACSDLQSPKTHKLRTSSKVLLGKNP